MASATTTTLAGMVVNALNKVVRMHYDNLATYRWYEQIVDVLPHDGSTHDVQLIMVDGVSNLSTVTEGAAYTELTVSDSKETIPFSKKGNFVGITLEMFRRSDIAKLQAIPRALMAASLRTRSSAIASIFTANSGAGPTMANDSKALFHTDHGNLDTTAFSAAAWATARQRLWKQLVPGTAKPLSLWPAFCLVPIELFDAALEVFGYGEGDIGLPTAAGTAQKVNPYALTRAGDPRPVPIVVPDWSDTNNWAYLVDPRLQPVICMAYASAPAGGLHALQQAGVQGTVVLLQATSPLRTPADIRAAVDLFATGAHGLVMSVTEADRGVLKWGRLEGSRFVPLSSPEHCFANRQSLPPVVRPNGAVYVFDAARLIATGSLAADSVGVVGMPPERSHDIDNLNDCEQAERLLARPALEHP